MDTSQFVSADKDSEVLDDREEMEVKETKPSPPPPSSSSSPQDASVESDGSPHKRARSFSQFVKEAHKKIKLRGIEAVNEDHPLFAMATCIQKGLQMSRKEYNGEVGTADSLSPESYTQMEEHSVATSNPNKVAVFRSFAPDVFQALRNILGIQSNQYYEPLSETPFLKYASNSRNGQTFFLCSDKRYFVKTENAMDAKFFLQILPQYVGHLSDYPHSLLVRILGLHYIKLPGKKGKFFSVMQSVFHPEERIYARYDIKGCILHRYVSPEKQGSDYVSVLKDVNFGDQKLVLKDQREWFLRQIDIDVDFLRGFNIMDYSLLVGQQVLHFTETGEDTNLAQLVLRVRKSLPQKLLKTYDNLTEGTKKSSQVNNVTDSRSENEDRADLPGMVTTEENLALNPPTGIQYNTNLKGSQEAASQLGTVLTGGKERDPRLASELQLAFQRQNRRLLPNQANAVHIINGPHERYFVGIIDILGQYTVKKRLENILKSCIAPRTPFSAVNPSKYARRFKDYFAAHSE
ncbi:phosphatidylinositol 4-phosphate 5-kinase-like protein 1 [Diadema antillarum]|uniref:phosphatidylinositol 4-phosphate 5-kinase-like protein 1 n=1 Tax=Diadema antillarum TaxID=105358 RepID=UPI003A89993A